MRSALQISETIVVDQPLSKVDCSTAAGPCFVCLIVFVLVFVFITFNFRLSAVVLSKDQESTIQNIVSTSSFYSGSSLTIQSLSFLMMS